MNCIIIVNKEPEYTSRDVVNIISKLLNTKKVGHTGTLDPSASGVLVVCVGKALKICDMLINHDKEYIADIILGIETDTLDMDGKVLSTENVDIEQKEIFDAVNSFKGYYLQEVPKYSAVRVNGKKLYEYARKNMDVVLPKKMVLIKEITIMGKVKKSDGKINFKIKCCVSKGTYIRSLVRDIGSKLGVSAVMNNLIRTKLGNFSLNEAYTIDEIRQNKFKFIKIEDALSDLKRVIVDDNLAFKIKNGCHIKKFDDADMKLIFDKDNKLLAIYKNEGDYAKVYKMFV